MISSPRGNHLTISSGWVARQSVQSHREHAHQVIDVTTQVRIANPRVGDGHSESRFIGQQTTCLRQRHIIGMMFNREERLELLELFDKTGARYKQTATRKFEKQIVLILSAFTD